MAIAVHPNRSKRLYLPNEHLFTRKQFEEIAASGIFPPDARLELIEGRIINKELPMKSPHATSVTLAEMEMRRIFPSGHVIRVQLPIALGVRNEPLPDVAVVTGDVRDYEEDHPTTVVLIIEVSDTTLRYDTVTKARIYARAEIPEYWVVNLTARVLMVHRRPAQIQTRPLRHEYEEVIEYTETESLSPLVVPDAVVQVADLLPRRRP